MAAPMWSRFGLALVVVLLLFTAYNGIVEGLNAAKDAATVGQRLATAAQLMYGGYAIVTLLAIVMRHRWTFRLLALWGGLVTVTGFLAPVVWADSPVRVGLIAGVSTAAIIGLLLMAWRRYERYAGSPLPDGEAPT